MMSSMMAAALAVAAAAPSGAQTTSCAFPDLSGSGVRIVGAAASGPSLAIDAAAMRVEGAQSGRAASFVDDLPSGVSVMPFGTAYAVHVPAARVRAVWDAIDAEGRRTLLAGSSSSAAPGRQEAAGLAACGASAFAARSPTPVVLSVDGPAAVVAVGARRVAVSAGDMDMVVQDPPAGGGFEIVVSRFARR